MTRILYVISNSRIGGAETILARILDGLDRTRFEPHVIVTNAIGPLHDRYQAAFASLAHHLHSLSQRQATASERPRGEDWRASSRLTASC